MRMPSRVSSIGLVVGLEGTGGGAPPGELRKLLEMDLQKRRVQNIKELLASKNTSLVIVSGQIPAGARKDDPLDLVVSVPRESKTTSLRGGFACCRPSSSITAARSCLIPSMAAWIVTFRAIRSPRRKARWLPG